MNAQEFAEYCEKKQGDYPLDEEQAFKTAKDIFRKVLPTIATDYVDWCNREDCAADADMVSVFKQFIEQYKP